jgi:hypothetical protein
MHLLRTTPLINSLAARQVGGTDQARYLLVSFLIFIVPGYLGLLPSSGASYTWPLAFEAWFYIAIAVFGILAARDAAGGNSNQNFITEFTCLYVPVAVTTLGVVWSVYWATVLLLQNQLAAWSWSGTQFTENLRAMGTDLFGLATFLAHVASNTIIYVRLVRLLRTLQAAK